MLAFADFYKTFLLETNASKLGLEAVLSQKEINGWYHAIAYGSQSLTIHDHNYYWTKQEFLVLKWVIAELFQVYLLWTPFIVRTDNKLLPYTMTTPNLDSTQHQWVESLATLTFSIEYQKGRDNVTTDALSQVTSKLDAEIVKSILDGVTLGTTKRAHAQDTVVAEADEEILKLLQEATVLARGAQTHVGLCVIDTVTTQQEDPMLKTMIKWISNQKVQDLKHLLGDDTETEEGKTIFWEQKKLTLYQGALYHYHTPNGE